MLPPGQGLGDALFRRLAWLGFTPGGMVPAVTWYPSRFGYKDGLQEGTYSLAAGFAINVVCEFIFHR